MVGFNNESKGLIFLILIVLLGINAVKAQNNSVAIGSETINNSAVLWLNGNGSQGLLLPVADKDNFVPASTDEGMVIYDAADNTIYYFNGAQWIDVNSSDGASNNYTLVLNGNDLQLLKDGAAASTVVIRNIDVGGDLSGTIGATTLGTGVVSLTNLGDMGAANGQILMYDGTAWTIQDAPSGTFTGVTTDGSTLTGDGLNTPLSILDNDDADADPTNEFQDADDVDYDNTASGLDANNVQDAMDELADELIDITAYADEVTITAFGGIGDELEVIDGSITGGAGGKIAASTIDSGNLEDGAVTPPKIQGKVDPNNSVLGSSGNGAVTWITGGIDQLVGTDNVGNLTFINQSVFNNLDKTNQNGILIGNGTNIINVPAANNAIFRGNGTSLVNSSISDNGTSVDIFAMSIKQGGNVGIGTNMPNYSLEVIGNIFVNGQPNTSFGPNWNVISDQRLKNIIGDYKDGLNVIRAINPLWFQYNGQAGIQNNEIQVGIIAQEMLKIAPYTVSTFNAKLNEGDEEETELLKFNFSALNFAQINAIKELDEKNQQLEKENIALRKQLEQLAQRLNASQSKSTAEMTQLKADLEQIKVLLGVEAKK